MLSRRITAAVGMAASALFVGAGSAQADITADILPGNGGVTTIIHAVDGDLPAPSGACTYSASAQGNPFGKPLPAVNWPIVLPDHGAATVWFPSYPTGSTWDISVDCPNGGRQWTQGVY